MLHGNDEVINHEADCSTTVRVPNVRDYGVSDLLRGIYIGMCHRKSTRSQGVRAEGRDKAL